MSKMRNFGIAIIVVLVFLITFLAVSHFTKKPQMSINFSAGTKDGTVITLHDVMQGRGGALIFIDPEIEGSILVLEKLMKYVDNDSIIAISVSKLSEAEQIKLLPETVLLLKNLCFEGSEAITGYNIGNAPVTYFIQKDLYIADAFLHNISEKSIQKTIEKIKAA